MEKFDLQKALDRLKMSQTALADRLGVDKATVNRWCVGSRPVPENVSEYIRVLMLARDILESGNDRR